MFSFLGFFWKFGGFNNLLPIKENWIRSLPIFKKKNCNNISFSENTSPLGKMWIWFFFSWQDFVQVLFYPFLGGLVSWHFKNDEIVIQTRTKEREFWFILNNKIFFCNLCLLNSVVFFFENCGKWNFLCPVGEKPKRNNTIPWLTLHIWRSNFDFDFFFFFEKVQHQ